MSSRDGNEPAFPASRLNGDWIQPGMTMREWYAGMALQVVWADRPPEAEEDIPRACQTAAAICFEIADAMIAESAKPRGPQPRDEIYERLVREKAELHVVADAAEAMLAKMCGVGSVEQDRLRAALFVVKPG